MDKRTVKIDGEEFVVTKGPGECELSVANGNDTGSVTWFKATGGYKGTFNGRYFEANTVERAVQLAARQIIKVRLLSLNQKPAKGWISTLKISPVSQNTLK